MTATDRSTETAEPRFDYRLHVAVILFSVLVQTIAALIRVGTSYRVLELGLPVIWLGVIFSAFALLPVFIAIRIGRFIDRGNDALAAWIGSAVMGLSCVAFGLMPTSPIVIALTMAGFGIGYMYLMISLQVLCIRSARPDAREQAFGNYMAANAVGQGLGPLMVGWLGGTATIPDTAPIYGLAMALGIAIIFVAFALRPAPAKAFTAAETPSTPLSEMVRIPGLLAVMFASVMAITAQDLVTFYLPVLGTERGIAAAWIGAVLTIRSVASLVSRLLYARLVRHIGHWPLMVISMGASAAAFVVMALPVPVWIMFVSGAVMGFGLGVATTLSITMVVQIAPPEIRATVMTVRISGNRLGQIVLPLVASLVAVATGAWGILAMTALTLAASSAAVQQASVHAKARKP